jgi:hypothetical protein
MVNERNEMKLEVPVRRGIEAAGPGLEPFEPVLDREARFAEERRLRRLESRTGRENQLDLLLHDRVHHRAEVQRLRVRRQDPEAIRRVVLPGDVLRDMVGVEQPSVAVLEHGHLHHRVVAEASSVRAGNVARAHEIVLDLVVVEQQTHLTRVM